MSKNIWVLVEHSKVELEGPYECSACEGHIMLDATYLEQVSYQVTCPYCQNSNEVGE